MKTMTKLKDATPLLSQTSPNNSQNPQDKFEMQPLEIEQATQMDD